MKIVYLNSHILKSHVILVIRNIIHEKWKIIIKSTNSEDFPSNRQKIISFKEVFSRCHSKCKEIQFLSWLGSKGLTSFEDYLLPTGFPVCVSIHFSFLGIVSPFVWDPVSFKVIVPPRNCEFLSRERSLSRVDISIIHVNEYRPL